MLSILGGSSKMGPYKDFAVLMLIIAGLLAGAIIFLRVRDRRTLRPEMSPAERRRAVARNSAHAAHWWHVAGLAAIINALLLDRDRVPHQRAWTLVFDAAISAFLIFRYYSKRSDEQSKPASSSNSVPPIH
jgi:hypothetical protein